MEGGWQVVERVGILDGWAALRGLAYSRSARIVFLTD